MYEAITQWTCPAHVSSGGNIESIHCANCIRSALQDIDTEKEWCMMIPEHCLLGILFLQILVSSARWNDSFFQPSTSWQKQLVQFNVNQEAGCIPKSGTFVISTLKLTTCKEGWLLIFCGARNHWVTFSTCSNPIAPRSCELNFRCSLLALLLGVCPDFLFWPGMAAHRSTHHCPKEQTWHKIWSATGIGKA